MNRTTPLSSIHRRFALAAPFAVVAFAFAVFATTSHDAATAPADAARAAVALGLALCALLQGFFSVGPLSAGTWARAHATRSHNMQAPCARAVPVPCGSGDVFACASHGARARIQHRAHRVRRTSTSEVSSHASE